MKKTLIISFLSLSTLIPTITIAGRCCVEVTNPENTLKCVEYKCSIANLALAESNRTSGPEFVAEIKGYTYSNGETGSLFIFPFSPKIKKKLEEKYGSAFDEKWYKMQLPNGEIVYNGYLILKK